MTNYSRPRFFVGIANKGATRTVFRASSTPTQESHGHLYGYAVGPFDTKRGAEYFASHHLCAGVYDAERAAAVEAINPFVTMTLYQEEEG